ncbi:MAG TPA: hypothetical protein VGH32_00205, partial [Pirellulales bacterium]
SVLAQRKQFDGELFGIGAEQEPLGRRNTFKRKLPIHAKEAAVPSDQMGSVRQIGLDYNVGVFGGADRRMEIDGK